MPLSMPLSSKFICKSVGIALIVWGVLLLPAVIGEASATTYTLPVNSNDSVINQFDDNVPLTRSEQNETLLNVARRFHLGQTEIVRLNPAIMGSMGSG